MNAPKLQTRPELLRQWGADICPPGAMTVAIPTVMMRALIADAKVAHELNALVNSSQTVDLLKDVPHPVQPSGLVDGVLRFKKNAIVEHLLENGGIDMNDLARLSFTDEDRRQFAQLIGYSLSGYYDLSYGRIEAGEIK